MSEYKHYTVPQYLTNSEKKTTPLDIDDLQCVPLAEVAYRGICSDHIESGNDFMKNGISQIIMKEFVIERTIKNERDKTEEDKRIDNIHVSVVINSVSVKTPTTTHYASSREEMLTPKMALLEDKTYASNIYIDADIIATAHLKNGGSVEKKASVSQILIATMPVMVKGNLCNTSNKSYENLVMMEEDPGDPGGYYIVKGIEWVINSMESTPYNLPKFFRNIGFKNERARAEIISKPGDAYENSSQTYVKMLTDDQLVIIIDRSASNFNEIQIPFFILLRILGWSSDKQMVDWIVYNYDVKSPTPLQSHMLEKLNLAFKAKYTNFGEASHLYSRDDILRSLLNKMLPSYEYLDLNDEKTIQFVYNKIMWLIDHYLLPHIGVTPDSRNEKAIYITYLIRRLFMTEMQVIEQTDRDTLKIKRAHSAGVSLAKAFKTQFNFVVVQPIRKQFLRDSNQQVFLRWIQSSRLKPL